MADQSETAERVLLADGMVLPVEWRRPYADLDVYRFYVGPFYAGEVARTISDGWKALSAISPRIISHPTKEAAQIDIEMTVRSMSGANMKAETAA